MNVTAEELREALLKRHEDPTKLATIVEDAMRDPEFAKRVVAQLSTLLGDCDENLPSH